MMNRVLDHPNIPLDFDQFFRWIPETGVAATHSIGSPKQPTVSVYSLENGEYQLQQFCGDQVIQSPTFPELRLTANQVFQAN